MDNPTVAHSFSSHSSYWFWGSHWRESSRVWPQQGARNISVGAVQLHPFCFPFAILLAKFELLEIMVIDFVWFCQPFAIQCWMKAFVMHCKSMTWCNVECFHPAFLLRNRPCDGRKTISFGDRFPRKHPQCDRCREAFVISKGRWCTKSVEGCHGEGSQRLQPALHGQKA